MLSNDKVDIMRLATVVNGLVVEAANMAESSEEETKRFCVEFMACDSAGLIADLIAMGRENAAEEFAKFFSEELQRYGLNIKLMLIRTSPS